MVDDGWFVGEGLVDGAGCAGVDEDVGDFGEVERVVAEGEHLAGAAGALIAEAEVEHGVLAAVFDDVGVGGEAAVAGVGCGWVLVVERI